MPRAHAAHHARHGTARVCTQVHFHGQKMLSVDEALGRAAHVGFLEHVPFMRLFAARYAKYFRDEDVEL